MNAYVDESGDAGTCGKGSRWLVFGCVLVRANQQGQVDGAVTDAGRVIKQLKNRPDIHFKKLDHADKRGTLELLTKADWHAIVVASDTTKISDGSYLIRPEFQYNYPLRYAIERISNYAEEHQEPIEKIVIESRRNFDLAAFQEYLGKLKERSEPRISWGYFDPSQIVGKSSSMEPNLCIADGLAHSVFKALEPDPHWGHHEPSYLNLVRDKLWSPKNVDNSSFVLMPTSLREQFLQEYDWLKDVVPPRWIARSSILPQGGAP